MKWHEMSSRAKAALVKECWDALAYENLYLGIGNMKSSPYKWVPLSDEAVLTDGHLTLCMSAEYGGKFGEEISYRSIHPDNINYIKHVLKTLAYRVAKAYFGLY